MRLQGRSRLISFGNPFLTRGGRTNLARRRHFAGRANRARGEVAWVQRHYSGWGRFLLVMIQGIHAGCEGNVERTYMRTAP